MGFKLANLETCCFRHHFDKLIIFSVLAILKYRNTPIDDIGSPVELLMSKKLNSLLPTTQKKLRPTPQPQQVTKARMLRRQKKQKQYYDNTMDKTPKGH